MKVTYHFSIERKDRINFIKQYIGFGNPVATTIHLSKERAKKHNTPIRNILTDTGIIFIISLDSNEIITAYIATIPEAVAIYRQCHNKRPPDSLIDNVRWNVRNYSEICP